MATATTLETSSIFAPEMSVFVSANAGSGKTSLLTKRVLSLLVHGAPPGKILCLTFTNAAAAEMANRVLKDLGAWVMLDNEALIHTLRELTGQHPDKRMLARARGLFASVLEAPDGVRIQTIHGFCQSLLRRFPVEAGVSPHFMLMDTRSEEEALREARLRLFARMQEGDEKARSAMQALAADSGEYNLQDILAYIVKNKRRLTHLVTAKPDLDYACEKTWDTLGISPRDTFATLLAKYLPYEKPMQDSLQKAAALLLESKSEKDQEKGRLLASWLAQEKTAQAAEAYFLFFYTKEGTPRKSLHTQAAIKDEAVLAALKQEAQRVEQFRDAWLSLGLAQRSTQVMWVAHALLSLYETLKQASAWLDYDDLILCATTLLSRPEIAPWVLYKLDGGIDHMLVDEAQDTSPEQWAIVQALADDFFAGEGRKSGDRSLFIVGDEKQSIFRFQGADVAALRRMQDFFYEKIHASGCRVQRVGLTKSYRSLPEILAAVDAVFAEGKLQHTAHRKGHGLVEFWPLATRDADETHSPQSRLIWQIAGQIESWLKEGIMLPSTGKAATPGDIMVLVRTRTSFVEKLSRALKRKNIPVAGVDRMRLTDNLAVQDLLALGQFLLLPEDDLTLACLLKSPIGNLSEEELFALAHPRGEASLWQQLAKDACFADIYALLSDLRSRVDFLAPYELYAYLLDTLGVRKRFLGRMGAEYADPIDEFLLQALQYEQSHTASLQGFLHWLSGSEAEIKRDMEQPQGAVRIMTVHGAKGLQAPIVILPDTTSMAKTDGMTLWDKAQGLPFWPRSQKQYNALCWQWREAEQQEEYAEYCRQLYVAMTRAEDMLIICGCAEKNAGENSWYTLAENGLKPVSVPYEGAEGVGLRLGMKLATSVVKKAAGTDSAKAEGAFSFLTRPAPLEPEPSRPLAPSRMEDNEPASASPLQERKQYSRGRLIHSLLQSLPDCTEGERKTVAGQLAAAYAQVMSQVQIDEATTEALSIINHADFAFLFSGNSLAEAPITGTVQLGKKSYTISGQIDRLYLGEEIWVVDFKTGHLPPANPQGTPLPYRRQLALYRQLLAAIYPGKNIRCALLWTAAAQITELPGKLLDEALPDT